MDLEAAHRKLLEGGIPIDISRPRKGSIAVWLWMSRLARAYAGLRDWRDLEQARRYVFTRLGRTGAETILTELSPLPSAKLKRLWHTQGDLTKQVSWEELHRERWARLRDALNRYRPNLVVCYGLARKREFQELLEIREWQPLNSRIWKSDSGRHFLLPFFGNGQMSDRLMTEFVECDEFRLAEKLAAARSLENCPREARTRLESERAETERSDANAMRPNNSD